ncbi:pilus assembly FimT family protein [Desulfovibrio ferrophilus]|uniref:General secretion pathway protein H n=1 Tax=Desulfovibrio ferrophilus TaxID=241368 RepID=A0A2Z6AZ40_9BACT|nr:type II secretion system protein [Desulfovibrio ferrophilus]BBD08524.1 uncharacterized protein DFE_1798 [Desulfovibrio ferrophilus]
MRKAHCQSGFTLLEVVATLVIFGMLMTGAMLALNDDNDIRKEADLLRIRLRYAQSRAMGENIPYGIISTGSQYHLFRGAGAAQTPVFPGVSTINYAPPSDINVPAFTISFDQWGVPYRDSSQNTAINAALTLALTTTSGGATITESITVIPTTGFVP